MTSEDKQELLDDIKADLGALVSRDELVRVLGKTITKGHLANLDSAGNGPSEKLRFGNKKIVYTRKSVLEFIADRILKTGKIEQFPTAK